MTVTYVDVSHHDWNRRGGQLNWEQVRSATSPVAMVRAAYGDPSGYNPASPHAVDMMKAARAAGMLVGGYHNLITGDQASINRQVDYLRRTLDSADAAWAMLDVERYEELVARDLCPRWVDAQRFVDRWRTVDQRVMTVYLPRWIWDGHLGRPNLATIGAPIVASNYGNNPTGTPAALYTQRGGDTGPGWQPYGGVTPTIWQYGSRCNVPGASTMTDINAFRGSLDELRALLAGEDDMPTAKEVAEEVNNFRWDNGQTLYSNARDAAKAATAAAASAARVEAAVALLAGKDLVDEPAIVRGVLAGLNPVGIATAVVDALPPELARQVGDEIARRFAN